MNGSDHAAPKGAEERVGAAGPPNRFDDIFAPPSGRQGAWPASGGALKGAPSRAAGGGRIPLNAARTHENVIAADLRPPAHTLFLPQSGILAGVP